MAKAQTRPDAPRYIAQDMADDVRAMAQRLLAHEAVEAGQLGNVVIDL